MKPIDIGKDFSPTPLGRYREDGDFSGQVFRDDHLIPALRSRDKVEIVIDHAEGYGSSFLEEAFGGLVRTGGYTPAELRAKLTINFTDPVFELYSNLIWRYIDEAASAA